MLTQVLGVLGLLFFCFLFLVCGCRGPRHGVYKGRGLFAQRRLAKGEVIIRIPAECWISHRSILRSSTAAHVLREDEVLQAVIAEEQTWAMVIVIGME